MRGFIPCALTLAIGLGAGAVALAQSSGYTGSSQSATATAGTAVPGQLPLMTVRQLLDTGRDDQKARLQGYIVSHIKGDDYLFEDDTGRIEVDIDEEDFPAGEPIGPTQRVELSGEFDKEGRGGEFDVDRIELLR